MNETILLVDDEAAVTKGLTRRLKGLHLGWVVLEAHSVTEALELLQTTTVDVIVSDIAMPRRDGFDLLIALKEQQMTDQIPVIMLTGLGDEDLKRKAIEMGATDLLVKPVDLIDLQVRIVNTLKLKASIDLIRIHEKELLDLVAKRTAELESSRLTIVIRMAKIVEMRDETTGNHTIRVGCYAEEIARGLSLQDNYAKTIFLASMMHDIGKIAIPDSILKKPGKLTPEEWTIMQNHTVLGAEMLRDKPELMLKVMKERRQYIDWLTYDDSILAMAERIAYSHHEHWDGSGYPTRCSEDSIPLEARIVTIADEFDALTTHRPYRAALADRDAIKLMAEDHRGHFDPQVFDAFIRCMPRLVDIRSSINQSNAPALKKVA